MVKPDYLGISGRTLYFSIPSQRSALLEMTVQMEAAALLEKIRHSFPSFFPIYYKMVRFFLFFRPNCPSIFCLQKIKRKFPLDGSKEN
uniref:Uncharacterized protein n=1 Tax=Meloidogyne incognita TaxID=6306 RepID=A0A914NEF2_MELIC